MKDHSKKFAFAAKNIVRRVKGSSMEIWCNGYIMPNGEKVRPLRNLTRIQLTAGKSPVDGGS